MSLKAILEAAFLALASMGLIWIIGALVLARRSDHGIDRLLEKERRSQ